MVGRWALNMMQSCWGTDNYFLHLWYYTNGYFNKSIITFWLKGSSFLIRMRLFISNTQSNITCLTSHPGLEVITWNSNHYLTSLANTHAQCTLVKWLNKLLYAMTAVYNQKCNKPSKDTHSLNWQPAPNTYQTFYWHVGHTVRLRSGLMLILHCHQTWSKDMFVRTD